jgi:hypothetical protein
MTDKPLPIDAHCIGCQGWTEPEYLRREKCPGLNLDAARVAAPSDGLREADDGPWCRWPVRSADPGGLREALTRIERLSDGRADNWSAVLSAIHDEAATALAATRLRNQRP